jgi:hypothetical protein
MSLETRSGRLPIMYVTTREKLVDGQCSAVMLERLYYPGSFLLLALLSVILMACGVTQ